MYDILAHVGGELFTTLTTTPSQLGHRFFAVLFHKTLPQILPALLSPPKLTRCYLLPLPRHLTLFVPLFPISAVPFQTNPHLLHSPSDPPSSSSQCTTRPRRSTAHNLVAFRIKAGLHRITLGLNRVSASPPISNNNCGSSKSNNHSPPNNPSKD